MIDFALLIAAAFGAGIVNTIAGGGTFLTFPALLLAGVPPVAANATSTVAVFPGYLGGALGFRRELLALGKARIMRLTALVLVGGLVGSLLLLVSSNEAFSAIVPFLLLAATLAFVFGQRLRDWAARRGQQGGSEGALGLLGVSLYGGYFNGGLGIVLLALFSLWGYRDIHQMNGLKTWLSFSLSAISVAAFSLAGIIHWPEALVMMVAALAGGYLGAPIARTVPQWVVRTVVAIIGFATSAVFFVRLVA